MEIIQYNIYAFIIVNSKIIFIRYLLDLNIKNNGFNIIDNKK